MTQERQLTLHTPNNRDLLVRRIEGSEGLSRLFAYEVTLYALTEDVDLTKLVGEPMCVGLLLPSGAERFFHGYVAACGVVGTEGEFTLYHASLRPQLWRLTQNVDCRIFQGETVPEIVESIFKEYGLAYDMASLHGGSRDAYLPWEYCVQYRESDFAFVSRLLEREGIHYWFEHEEGRELLVLADSNTAHVHINDYEKLHYTRAVNMHNRREESAWEWRSRIGVLPDRSALTDYDFTKPGASLASSSLSDVQRAPAKARDPEAEIYDHLETFVQQKGYTPQLGEVYARIRSEELHTRYAVSTGQTDARGLCAGALFGLLEGPTSTTNVEYMVTDTRLSAEMDLRTSGSDSGQSVVYRCTFDAIDWKVPYRPARTTPKPVIPGPQSAIVTGPKGAKDVYTDEWGRVFLKFHWYRPPKDGQQDKSDKEISCWVRVSQNSAGANWGSMFVPHLGQEVIVGFYEGDPDRPVVTGRVYNGSNKPPLTLPDYAYKSVIRDHFSNELLFDGTPGGEHISLYSPSHKSAVIVGKSTVEFTSSGKKTCSYDSESYAFGQKLSFTKGTSLSFDRGFFLGIKAGVGFSLTAGADVKASISNVLEFKGGMSATYLTSTSMTWGFGREFKKSKGSYTRMSDKDIVIDSSKTAYLTGGKNDNTLLQSSDKELVLSYDDSAADRSSLAAAADAAALKNAATIAGLGALCTYVGSSFAQFDVSRKGEQLNKATGVKSIQAELDQISGLGWSDLPTAVGAFGSAYGAMRAVKHEDIPSPEHPAPSAKITLKRELIQLFAGKDKESELLLQKDAGILLGAKRGVAIDSDEGGVDITAAKPITLKSSDSVVVDALLKHRNMKVML